MSLEQNLSTALTLITAYNDRNLDPWRSLLHEEFTADYPGAPGLSADRASDYHQAYIDAFPDVHMDIVTTVAEGDRVAAQWTATGSHTAPLDTLSGGAIMPTGKSVTLDGVVVTALREGRIVHEASFWDQVALLSQLGLIPA